MAYTIEWNQTMNSDDVKRTICKLHITFMFLPFMNFSTVLKIVVNDKDRVQVYSSLGRVFYYEEHPKHEDRLEQVYVKSIGD